MNRRELMLNCIRGSNTGRFPVGVIDAGTWILADNSISMNDLLLSEDHGTSFVAGFFDRFDFDFVWTAPASYNYVMGALGGEVIGSRKGFAPELTSSFMCNGGFVPEWDDDAIADRLFADRFIRSMISQTECISRMYKDDKPVAINYVGPFTLASQIVGMTEFMMILLDESGKLKDLLELSERICRTFYRIMTEAGADVIFIGEPSSSGDLISPDMFTEISLPYIQKLCSDVKGLAEFTMLHICGNIRDRIKMLVGSGIDALSLDSIDIGYAVEQSEGDFAIMGNVPPVKVLCDCTAEEVLSYCKGLIAERKDGERFVLLPGCDLPPGTDDKNILAMIESVR